MNDEEAREMLEGGPGRPAGHIHDIPEGQGEYAFGSPWSGLAKLAEECGELVTVIGKLMGTGGDPLHWQGDLTARLQEEMGDVRAALLHVSHYTPVQEHKVFERSALKRDLFRAWHEEGKKNRTP